MLYHVIQLILPRQNTSQTVECLGEPGISVQEDFQVGHTSNITCIAEYSAPPASKLNPTHAPSMRVYIEDVTPLVLAEEYVVLQTAYNEDIYILQQVRNKIHYIVREIMDWCVQICCVLQTFVYLSTVEDDGKTIVCEISTEEPANTLSSEIEILLHCEYRIGTSQRGNFGLISNIYLL